LFIAFVLASVAAVARVGPVSAQTVRTVDLSAGYLNVSGSMHGANAQLTAAVSDRVRVLGELNTSRGTDCALCEPKYRDTSWLAGARIAFLPARRFSPFAQFLIGGLQSTYDDYSVPLCCGLPNRREPGATVSYLALQPGGGLTAMFTPRFGVQSQVDVQLATAERYEGISIFPRVVVGGVVRLGRVE
jgi:hypothetical protein